MSIKLRWYGHNAWMLDVQGVKILIDPFISNSPASPEEMKDVSQIKADFILVSHGHNDHLGDTVKIARNTSATVVAMADMAGWLHGNGVQNILDMNLGGTVMLRPGLSVKMTYAAHSSTLPDGKSGGNSCGFLITMGEKNIYFACDTALFSDMQLICPENLTLAVLPIGDRYTMGPADALSAVTLLKARRVLACHYSTWPLIRQDVEKWTAQVRALGVDSEVLTPGNIIEV